jgi:hypothetical protein
MRAGRSLPASFAMGIVRIYQKLVSPSLGRNCRFSPTCSSYAYQAIDRFGVIRGGWLALRRLGRCQPLVEGGYDPVPDRLRLG